MDGGVSQSLPSELAVMEARLEKSYVRARSRARITMSSNEISNELLIFNLNQNFFSSLVSIHVICVSIDKARALR